MPVHSSSTINPQSSDISFRNVDFSQRLITHYFSRSAEPSSQRSSPPPVVPRESGTLTGVAAQTITVLHCNIDRFLFRRDELEGRLLLLPILPSLIFLNETKLDKSCPVPALTNYTVVSRKDRNMHGGGILVFVLDNMVHLFSPLHTSVCAELVWLLYHSSNGPVLLACMYRPPHYGEIASFNAFSAEWASLSAQAVGTVLIGDLNLHNTRWLRFSTHTAPEGLAMEHWCMAVQLENPLDTPSL